MSAANPAKASTTRPAAAAAARAGPNRIPGQPQLLQPVIIVPPAPPRAMTLADRIKALPKVPGLTPPTVMLDQAHFGIHIQRTRTAEMLTSIACGAILPCYGPEVAARLAPIVAQKVEQAILGQLEPQAKPSDYTARSLTAARHALDQGDAPPAAATDDLLVDYLVAVYSNSNPDQQPPKWQPQSWLRDMNLMYPPKEQHRQQSQQQVEEQSPHSAAVDTEAVVLDSEDEVIIMVLPTFSSTDSAPSAPASSGKKRKFPDDDSSDTLGPSADGPETSADDAPVLDGKPAPRSVKLRRTLEGKNGSVSPEPSAAGRGRRAAAPSALASSALASSAAATPARVKKAVSAAPSASETAAPAPDRQVSKARSAVRGSTPSPVPQPAGSTSAAKPSLSASASASAAAKPTAASRLQREPTSRTATPRATLDPAATLTSASSRPPVSSGGSNLLSTLGLAGLAPPARRPPVSASTGSRPPVSASSSSKASIADLIPTQRTPSSAAGTSSARTKLAPPARTNSAPSATTATKPASAAAAAARKPSSTMRIVTTAATSRTNSLPSGVASPASAAASVARSPFPTASAPVPSLYTFPALTWGAARAYVLTTAQLNKCDFPLPSRIAAGVPTMDPLDIPRAPSPSSSPAPGEPILRKCARCGKSFDITAPLAAGSGGKCMYHWGRTEVIKSSGDTLRVFACCQEQMGTLGCTESVHVYREERGEYLHAMEAFVETPPRRVVSASGKRPLEIVALDCEMCYTSLGMEVCRVTVIDQWKHKVIDELVKPKGVVRDLNTRYSGIKSLDSVTKTLADIRSALFEVIDDQTILVGHGLENDLKALRLVHYLIVDTSELFRKHEAERKPSLKKLADSILARTIQQGGSEGHDSLEDATVALDLLVKKVSDPDRTIFQG